MNVDTPARSLEALRVLTEFCIECSVCTIPTVVPELIAYGCIYIQALGVECNVICDYCLEIMIITKRKALENDTELPSN